MFIQMIRGGIIAPALRDGLTFEDKRTRMLTCMETMKVDPVLIPTIIKKFLAIMDDDLTGEEQRSICREIITFFVDSMQEHIVNTADHFLRGR